MFNNLFSSGDPNLGLALGSGGARGLSHIGVIKALSAEGYQVTHIAGSSIGALVGGLYAAGHSVQDIEAIAASMNWSRMGSLFFDPSFRRGLLRGKKIVTFLEEHLGDKTFADCQVPFVALATDRHTGEAVILNEGRLVDAIRASIAIPFIFDPLEYQGRELIDGGVATPVPVQVVRDLGATVVVAVNLDRYYHDQTIVPSWFDLINDALNISRHHLAAAQTATADVVLDIDAGRGWYDFIDSASCVVRGEEAMNEALPRLQMSYRQARPWWQRWYM